MRCADSETELVSGSDAAHPVLLHAASVVALDDVDEREDLIGGDVVHEHLVHGSVFAEPWAVDDVHPRLQ